MVDMPTVGLKVDLNEIVAAKAQYSALQEQIAAVGATSTTTAKATTDAAKAQAAAADYLLGVEIQSAKMAAAAADQAIKERNQAAAAAFTFRTKLAQQEADDAIAQAAAAARGIQMSWRQRDADAAAAAAAQITRDREMAADAATAARAQIALQNEIAAAVVRGQAIAVAAQREATTQGLALIRLKQTYQKQIDADVAAAAAAQIALDRERVADAAAAAAAQIALEKEVVAATLKGEAEIAAANKEAGISALQIREPIVLVREALRGDFTRMAGSTTLLAQAFGVLTPEGLAVAGAIAAIVAPIALYAAGIEKASADTANFNNMLIRTGGILGQTQVQFQAMAQSISTDTGHGLNEVTKDLLAIANTGQFTASTLRLMTQNSIEWGDLTHQDSTKILNDFTKMDEGVLKWVDDFDKGGVIWNQRQREQIQLIEETQGKTVAEQKVMQDMYDWLGTKGKANVDILTQAIRNMEKAIDDAANALSHIASPDTSDRTAAIRKSLQDTQDAIDSTGFETDQQRQNIAGWNAELNAISIGTTALNAFNQAQAARQQHAQQQIQDSTTLHDMNRTLRDDTVGLMNAEQQFWAVAKRTAADPTSTAEDRDQAQWDLAHTALVNAQLKHRFDAEHMPGSGGGGMAGAVNSVAILRDAVDSLNTQIADVNADPLADLADKIIKAGNAAEAARTAGKGNVFQTQASDLAQQKELATITLQWVDAEAKATRQQDDRSVSNIRASATLQEQFAIMRNFYATGATDAQSYADALNQVHQSALNAQIAQADLSIAQVYGATTVSGIAAAINAALAAKGQDTDQAKKDAAATQAQAQAHLEAATAVIEQADAAKGLTAVQDAMLASDAIVKQLNEETAAYQAGALALANYTRNQAINKELHDSAAAGQTLTPAQAAAIVDAQTIATGQLRNAQQDLTRLTNEGTAARAAEAQKAQIIAVLLAQQGKSEDQLTAAEKARLEAQASSAALIQQQIIDTQKLTQAIQDSIRQAFIDTGRLDFSSLKNALEKELNKAIYDAFLQKPIDIVVNAAVQWEQNALSSLLGQGGGSNSLGGQLANLAGGGGNGGSSVGGALSGLSSTLGSVMSAVSEFAGPVAIALQFAQISNKLDASVAKALGGNPNNIANNFGLLPTLIAALSGPGGANHRTVYGFDATGGIGALQPQSDNPTSATETAVQQMSQNLQSFISTLGQSGINAQGILHGIQFDQVTRSRLYYNTGPGAGAGGVQTTSNDPNVILSDIEKYLLQNANYSDANEKSLIGQMVAANDTLTEIETALAGYAQAQKDFKSVTEGLLQFTNPALYATQTLQDQQIARRQTIVKEIQAGYFTPDQIAQIAADLPQLEQQEIQQALAGVATSAGGAAHSLTDFVNAQKAVITFVNGLLVGSLSPLSPTDQLAAASTAYRAQLAAAKGGNYDALTGITNTAQTYLTQAQKVYGSGSAYASVFNDVTSALTDLGNQSGLTGNAQVDATNAASAALQAAIAAGALQIVAAVNDNTAAGDTLANNGTLTPAQVAALQASLAAGTEATVSAINDGFAALSASLGAASATRSALAGALAA